MNVSQSDPLETVPTSLFKLDPMATYLAIMGHGALYQDVEILVLSLVPFKGLGFAESASVGIAGRYRAITALPVTQYAIPSTTIISSLSSGYYLISHIGLQFRSRLLVGLGWSSSETRLLNAQIGPTYPSVWWPSARLANRSCSYWNAE